jgi:hypothetical protein
MQGGSQRVLHNQQTTVCFKRAPCHANSEPSKQQRTPQHSHPPNPANQQLQAGHWCDKRSTRQSLEQSNTHHKHSHRPAAVTTQAFFAHDSATTRNVQCTSYRHPHRMFTHLPRATAQFRSHIWPLWVGVISSYCQRHSRPTWTLPTCTQFQPLPCEPIEGKRVQSGHVHCITVYNSAECVTATERRSRMRHGHAATRHGRG